MATNLIELATSYLTDEVVHRASALVGESPDATRRALSTAVPAVVGGIAGEATTDSGAERLVRTLGEEGGAAEGKSSLGELLRSGSGEDLVQRGTALLGRILGPRMSPLVEATAREARVPTSAMASLLGLATPIVVGVIGHQVRARGLDAAGLASLLAEQKGAIPEGLLAAIHREPAPREPAVPAAPSREPAARAPRPAIDRAREARASRFWPALLLVPLAIVLGLLMRHRGAPLPQEWTHRRLGVGVSGPAPAPGSPSPRPWTRSRSSWRARAPDRPSASPSRT